LRELRKKLKKYLDKEVIDIFVIGSFLKNKLDPKDIDIIILFSKKGDFVSEKLFLISEEIGDKIHLETLFLDELFESIYFTILHEGFSVKENKFISDLMKIESKTLFNFSLEGLSNVEKVKFSQALYGRKKDGLLYHEKGESLGKGSFLIDVLREEILKAFFEKWKVKFKDRRIFVKDDR
jgi:hypothetical protein